MHNFELRRGCDWQRRRTAPARIRDLLSREGAATRAAVAAFFPTANLRRGTGGSARMLSFVPRRWSMSLSGWPGCNEHDFGSMVTLEAENAPPPYVWYCGEDTDDPATNQFRYVPFEEFRGEQTVLVGVRCDDGVHSNLVTGASIDAYGFRCLASATTFLPVAALPGFDVMANHAPRLESYTIHNGGNCPDACILDVYAGWTHNEALLHVRNLIRIVTHDPRDDDTSHCIGLVWRDGGFISLYDYLADCCKPFADKFSYYVNGEPCDGILEFGAEPTEFHPRVFHVELRLADGETVLDRMWVVVNARIAKDKFDDWYSRNSTNTNWTAMLPMPYAQISLSTNFLGRVSAVDPEPGNPNLWEAPRRIPAPYLHHDSKWEMRSVPDANNHRNQACYDLDGILVEAGIAAGTADYSATLRGGRNGHVPQDVDPYLHAVHLDGNPGDTTIINGLSRPCLYQGDNIDKYLQCRPTILP